MVGLIPDLGLAKHGYSLWAFILRTTAVGDREREERPDSHLAHILGETARNIFRSSLNREERKGREGRKTRIMHYFSSE